MRIAFGHCVSELLPVRVVDCPDNKERYVLEIEIRPQLAITQDMIFSFCNPEGKVVSYIKDGSSVIDSTNERFSRKGGENSETFEDVVKKCTRRREEDERQQHRRNDSPEIQRIDAVVFKLANATAG